MNSTRCAGIQRMNFNRWDVLERMNITRCARCDRMNSTRCAGIQRMNFNRWAVLGRKNITRWAGLRE